MPIEPETLRTTRYLCPWCRRGHSKKDAARAHIARCFLDPANRACLTCNHYFREEPDVGIIAPWCEAGIRVEEGSINAHCAQHDTKE